jgi:tetratricopeptide (TPR) repeat protein
MERILVASRAVWFYAGKLLWPADLTFSYPRWTISAARSSAYGWLLATAGLGAAICVVRRQVGRSVEVAVLFFVTTLGPVLGFIMLYTFRYSFVADHYQYVASIGLIALFSAGLAQLAGCLKRRKPWLEAMVCLGLLPALGTLTWRQARIYYNEETLWQTTIRRNPNCWMACNNLGLDYFQQGRMGEAIAQYQTALAIQPDYANAHNNLGLTYSRLGRMDEAIAQYQASLVVAPNVADIHYNLGNALLQQGRLDEAIAQYQTALVIDPDDAKARSNLGGTLLQQGRMDEAIAQYQTVLAITPDPADAHYNLGNALLQRGRLGEAIAHYQKALAIRPDFAEAHYSLGNALLQQGRMDEAIEQYQKALAIQPDYLEVQNGLAWVLATCPQASLRNGHKAVELAQQANQLSGGGKPVILCTLAAAYAETGRFPEAEATVQSALQLAKAQSNTALANVLESQLKLYQAGIPFHDTEETSSTRTAP